VICKILCRDALNFFVIFVVVVSYLHRDAKDFHNVVHVILAEYIEHDQEKKVINKRVLNGVSTLIRKDLTQKVHCCIHTYNLKG